MNDINSIPWRTPESYDDKQVSNHAAALEQRFLVISDSILNMEHLPHHVLSTQEIQTTREALMDLEQQIHAGRQFESGIATKQLIIEVSRFDELHNRLDALSAKQQETSASAGTVPSRASQAQWTRI